MTTKDNMKEYEHLYTGAQQTSLDQSDTGPPPAYQHSDDIEVTGDKEAIFASPSSSSDSLAPPKLPHMPTSELPIVVDPSRTLTLNAKGIKWFRLPTPDSQLEIDISRVGTDAPVYVSSRPKRSSGDCTLRMANQPKADVVSTQYRFGPKREPQIRLYNPSKPIESSFTEEVVEETENGLEGLGRGIEVLKIKSKWLSRSVSMVNTGFGGQNQPQSNVGVVYEWKYVKANDYPDEAADVDISREISESQSQGVSTDKKKKQDKPRKILTLTARDTSLGSSILDPDSRLEGRPDRQPEKPKVIAQLIRTRDTMAEGTKRRDAGNGGHLIFDVDADKYMAENLIVATCLMMLKKEVDCRRAAQFAMLAAMASSGGGG